MATITPKNIRDVGEEQREIRDAIYEKINGLTIDEPLLNLAKLDTLQFHEELYSHRLKCIPSVTIMGSLNGSYINIDWRIDSGNLQVRFYGNGKWEYFLSDTELATSYRGIGHRWTKENRYDENDSPYIFLLNDDAKEFITTNDEFLNDYQPLFRLDKSQGKDPTLNEWIKIQWVTNRYDGPLSGYCMYKGTLHYFDMVEERDIDRQRMYAAYKLNFFERMIARYQHMRWLFVLGHRPAYWLYWKIHEFKQMFKKWRYGERYYIVDSERRKSWLLRHEIVGFFTY